LPGLVEVGGRRGVDLLLRQLRPGDVLAGGIADPRGPIADDEDRLVTMLLVTAQRAQRNGVTRVNTCLGRVYSQLVRQPSPSPDPGCNVFAVDDLARARANRIPDAV